MAAVLPPIREQLRIAQNEGSSEEELSFLWQWSRSVKVRKAIASNPNSSANVLRAAARLYLEEVLTNPGFAVLELFDADDWIKKISLAYNDPEKYILNNNGMYYVNRRYNNDYFCWAILLSPNLQAWTLDRVLNCMGAGAFRRAIKNQEVKQKIVQIYESELNTDYKDRTNSWPFSLAALLILYKEDVLTAKHLYLGFNNFASGMASAPKAIFNKYIKNIHDVYCKTNDPNEKDLLEKLLGKTYLISRSHTLHWLNISDYDLSAWAGELYTKVLKFMLSKCRAGRSMGRENFRTIGSYVTFYIKRKYLGHTKSVGSITAAYEYIKENDLLDVKFSELGLILSMSHDVEVLAKCNMEVKNFFCRAGCLGSWVSATGSDPRYLLANEVNEAAYLKEGVNNLFFDQCSIRKVIPLDSSTFIF